MRSRPGCISWKKRHGFYSYPASLSLTLSHYDDLSSSGGACGQESGGTEWRQQAHAMVVKLRKGSRVVKVNAWSWCSPDEKLSALLQHHGERRLRKSASILRSRSWTHYLECDEAEFLNRVLTYSRGRPYAAALQAYHLNFHISDLSLPYINNCYRAMLS